MSEVEQPMKEAEALEKAKAATRAEMDAADERISANADGSFIVKLTQPITVAGEKHDRLTLEPVRVKHARATRDAEYELEAYADQLISPRGALDELTAELDYITCMRAAERALGKFRTAGRAT